MKASIVRASVVALTVIAAGCDDSTPTSPTSAPVLSNVANTTGDGIRGQVNMLDLAGRYTVTFIAAPACSQLPVAVRSRSYTGLMSPTGKGLTAFTAELSGAEFFSAYDTFWSGVGHDSARFSVYSWDAFNWWLEDQPIIERVGPTGFLAFMGTANAPLVQSPTAITAQFDGSISFCYALTPPAIAHHPPTCAAPIECRSDRHQITFARR